MSDAWITFPLYNIYTMCQDCWHTLWSVGLIPSLGNVIKIVSSGVLMVRFACSHTHEAVALRMHFDVVECFAVMRKPAIAAAALLTPSFSCCRDDVTWTQRRTRGQLASSSAPTRTESSSSTWRRSMWVPEAQLCSNASVFTTIRLLCARVICERILHVVALFLLSRLSWSIFFLAKGLVFLPRANLLRTPVVRVSFYNL